MPTVRIRTQCTGLLVGVICMLANPCHAGAVEEIGKMKSKQPTNAHFEFGGVVGDRVTANLDNWLLRAPLANPGMLEMFRVRDRQPVPKLVPWAGEFVGKYLISAIQARRMTADPALDALLEEVIGELIASQAEDGYLGPFRKEERLLGNWDLWGHYHAMLALMMWHEDTGAPKALQTVVRAADLICRIYLDSGRRTREAGWPEMNLAVIHALGRLYRHTGTERYLRMMREIEKDWQETGDYFRCGLNGVEFYKTPLPRWESLHNIQGLVELYRITGNEDYRTAYENLWRSIARNDRHNTGGFSTGEQAIGNPYTPGAIETCCTTAWMALSVDMLQLGNDSTVADELELSTWNSMLGSQHPSGRWWTYNTPMDGHREASAHTIVFQSRAGTPELNCCSVNAPRGLGMLSEWALTVHGRDIFVNYYGPMRAELDAPGGGRIRLEQETAYPVDGKVRLRVVPLDAASVDLRLHLRLPAWSEQSTLTLNGQKQDGLTSGRYVSIERAWKAEDVLDLNLDMSIRTWIGDGAATGKVSLYRGPLLLAFDTHWNQRDSVDIPPLDFTNLAYDTVAAKGRFQPMISLRFRAQGDTLNLCDFTSAGAYGTRYVSWLPVENAPPAQFTLRDPAPAARIPVGPYRFHWSGPNRADGKTYTFTIAADSEMKKPLFEQAGVVRSRFIFREHLKPGRYYWNVRAENPHGTSDSTNGPYALEVDATLPNAYLDNPAMLDFREDDLVCASRLDGDGEPIYGVLEETRNVQPTKDRHGKPDAAVAFSGDGLLRYRVPYFPSGDYSFTVWLRPDKKPATHLSQVFSAWAKGGDDPLRVVIEGEQLFMRIEGSGTANSRGTPIQFGEWMHVAVVKKGTRMALYINGERVTENHAPQRLNTTAEDFALGGNPHHSADEFLHGGLDDFAFYAKALTNQEIRDAYTAK